MSQQEESSLQLEVDSLKEELNGLKAEFAQYKREMEDILSVLTNDPEDFIVSLQPCREWHVLDDLWSDYRRYCSRKSQLPESRLYFESYIKKIHPDAAVGSGYWLKSV